MEWLQRLFDKVLCLLPEAEMIEPHEMGARITWGKRYRIKGPGLYVFWPLIQDVITMEVVTQVVDLPPQTVRTIDGHEIVVSGAVRFKIRDIEKALFAVQDIDKALATVALGVILEYVGRKTLKECDDVDGLKQELRKELASEASGWGLKIEQVYLTDLGRVRSLRLFGDNLRREN